MFKFNPFKRKKTVRGVPVKFPGANLPQSGELIENQLEIKIGDILVSIRRSTAFSPQNELSAFIPEATIFHRQYENGQLAAEEEIILSSITLVDSPRYFPETQCRATPGAALASTATQKSFSKIKPSK